MPGLFSMGRNSGNATPSFLQSLLDPNSWAAIQAQEDEKKRAAAAAAAAASQPGVGPYRGIGPGMDGSPLSTPSVPTPPPSGPPQGLGLFARMGRWGKTADANGLTGADKIALLGATLSDTAAGLDHRNGTAISNWDSQRQDRSLASSLNPLLTGMGADGKPVSPDLAFRDAQTAAIQSALRGGRGGSILSALPALRGDANRQAYLQGVPAEDRAIAAMDPEGYAKSQLQNRQPKVFNTGGGVVSVDPQTGETRVLYNSAKPDALTMDRVTASVFAKWQAGQPLSKQEQTIRDRYLNGTTDAQRAVTPNTIMGQIFGKVRVGGLESLSPGEKALWDQYSRRSDPFAALAGMAGGGMDDETPTAPPARAMTPRAAPAPQGRAADEAPPPEALRLLKPGQNTAFQNGQVWTIRNGKPVRVG